MTVTTVSRAVEEVKDKQIAQDAAGPAQERGFARVADGFARHHDRMSPTPERMVIDGPSLTLVD
jgi:hypothetical protein